MKSLATHCREKLSIESANESDGLREGFRANEKRREVAAHESFRLAGPTGLEPATSGVTGRRSNQLNYDPAVVGISANPLGGNCIPRRGAHRKHHQSGCQDEKISASRREGADASLGEREGVATRQSISISGSFHRSERSDGGCQSVVHL